MDITAYRERRADLARKEHGRATCPRCRKAVQTCYCHMLRPFTAPVPFVILQHPDEARNAIATARMAHLSILNSQLIADWSFAKHSLVNALIAAPARRNLLLLPSRDALPLDAVIEQSVLEKSRTPVFWVVDAKWSQVPKMMRLSPNLRALETVRFSPDVASRFQIRRQPQADYLSTIEAIYLVIDRFRRFQQSDSCEHQALVDVFQFLVRQQLSYVNVDQDTRHQAGKALRAARRLKKQAQERPSPA